MNTEKQTHTPGPWIAAELTRRPQHLSYYWVVRRGEDRDADTIALIPAEYPGEDAGEEANAQLIASAPDLLRQRDALLAACKKLIDHAELAHWDKQDSIFGITCNQARQAIAAAEKGTL